MTQDSKIEWTDHTANFWWGCIKVSPGCQHCYAETLSNRYGHNIWGPAATTDRERKKAVWQELINWDKQAEKEGIRRRVFVQSMSDFLEDHPQVFSIREEAKRLLENLKWLDVLILTKRPENAPRFLAEWFDKWPSHIWMGASVENQQYADKRIPELLNIPAPIHFLSVEPMLGEIDLELRGRNYGIDHPTYSESVDWVICGGESGPKARPIHPDWARSLRDQCTEAGVAFFFKQWGEWLPAGQASNMSGKEVPAATKYHNFGDSVLARVGKHNAGRLLDGREWNEYPVKIGESHA